MLAVTVVLLSRLVYRKGIDLVVQVIPQVCARHPEVRFIIGLLILRRHMFLHRNTVFVSCSRGCLLALQAVMVTGGWHWKK